MTRLPARALLAWFRGTQRDLPWRHERTAWRVWVAEAMLQQTTVAVALKRYPQFMKRFPTLRSLAQAEEHEALAAWAGLGYYRRVRALQAAAKVVEARHEGVIPRTEAELEALPGIGEYTAAAIVCFAFDGRAAVIDANVARVLARWLGHGSVTSSRDFRSAARERLLASMPAQGRDFSEALMELGALLCRPLQPECAACPLARTCVAHGTGREMEFPVAEKRKAATEVDSLRLLVRRGTRVVMVQRAADASLLPGFWELPGAWLPRGSATDAGTLHALLAPLGLKTVGTGQLLRSANHSITHHRLRCRLVEVVARGRLRGAALVDLARPQRMITTECTKLLAAEAHV
ncbi:MAG: A/G-specific adenine glycosylase [Planctomycetes bacterium]|nr:A/G-specific adenine glycosylase [Planctomycetota bacterium]